LQGYEDENREWRTYRYVEKEPMYPFGFGLSYTIFEYSDIALASVNIEKGESTAVTATISNNGDHSGEEVVQLYITDKEASVRVPIHSLKGFKRVEIGRA